MPIDVKHPHRTADLKEHNTHPRQIIPERRMTWKLEEDRWKFQDRTPKGNQQKPEHPPPMLDDSDVKANILLTHFGNFK